MDAWWNRYVGIPFAPGGNGVSGCDCWGLVRLVYRRVTDAAFVSPMLDLVRDAFWERVSVPSPGDVAVFRVRGYDSHVGLVTVPGYMLHVREGKDAVIEAYDRRFWKNAFRGVYRYRGHEAVRGLANPERVTLVGKPSVFAPRVTLCRLSAMKRRSRNPCAGRERPSSIMTKFLLQTGGTVSLMPET